MLLPLKDRASEDNPLFCLTQVGRTSSPNKPAGTPLIPDQTLEPGEQYRFHFDMTKCIGCKCCVVACNEQNGNPAEINWRRVGEIEGGVYPYTQRFYLSMGCNHCLEPSCLNGCPVDAYTKDALTGIVQHSADACIGCQYCTWNCSYGVPQYNPERGVVGKCDMCHGRLARRSRAACVNACPEGAIQIEIVNIADWKQDSVQLGNAPGHAVGRQDDLDDANHAAREPADRSRKGGSQPRASRASALASGGHDGADAAFGRRVRRRWLMELAGRHGAAWTWSRCCVGVANLALAASTLHLGRPIHAYRALKMWRRSWLSREVLLFSLFAGSCRLCRVAVVRLPGTVGAVECRPALLGLGRRYGQRLHLSGAARPAGTAAHVADFLSDGACCWDRCSWQRLLGVRIPAADRVAR